MNSKAKAGSIFPRTTIEGFQLPIEDCFLYRGTFSFVAPSQRGDTDALSSWFDMEEIDKNTPFLLSDVLRLL